jgi:choline-sulfatase
MRFTSRCKSHIGGITPIDEQVGRLMNALDESGQAEDTIAVFTSDAGEMLAPTNAKTRWFRGMNATMSG